MTGLGERAPRLGRRRTALHLYGVPAASVMAGSLLSALPMVAHSPILPPAGLMMMLCWRLLRPGLWPAWAALPLGLFDDMLSGQPLGSAMALWTAVLIGIDLAERRLIWRDYAHDWILATLALAFCLAGGWLFVRLQGSGGPITIIGPQFLISALLYPALARLCNRLDHWRLP